MPSENAFKDQAEIASNALKTFVAVQHSASTFIVKAAVNELIDATIAFNNFVPFFVSHPLFQEIPPAVFNTLEQFANKHPNFEMPSTIARVAGLDARVKNSMSLSSAKKGMPSPFLLLPLLIHFLSDSVFPAGPRADRAGTMRRPRGSVSLRSFSHYSILYYLFFLFS